MQKVRVQGKLFAPRPLIRIGNTKQKVVFSIDSEWEVDEDLLDLIANERGVIGRVSFLVEKCKYHRSQNTVSFVGYMALSTQDYMDKLTENGWQINQQNAEHYRLPCENQL